MANRTVKDAHTVKGTNPQYLIEKIVRTRIYDAKYWKEECFALSADLIVDKGMELRYIGGIYGGNIKPTPFLCLILKLLQIQPDKEIIIEYIRQEDFKYVRALGVMYMRLTGASVDVYKYLEPLYNDYRKLRHMNRMGEFEILHMDEFVDQLLREERVCDIQLPRLQKREALEDSGQLDERVSALDEDLDNVESASEDEAPVQKPSRDRRSPESKRVRSPKRQRSRERERGRRSRSNSPSSRRHKSPVRSSHKDKSRDREREKDKRESDRSRRSAKDDFEREIREANELRAKLGLKPLQP